MNLNFSASEFIKQLEESLYEMSRIKDELGEIINKNKEEDFSNKPVIISTYNPNKVTS